VKNCKPIIIQDECNKKDKSLIPFPARPADWNAKFKLHAPLNSTIEGELKNRKICYLNVFPELRGKDIIFENFKP
jgi:hypothetical protein